MEETDKTLPPSLKEDIDNLKQESAQTATAEVVEPKKRGRKPGSKNKVKEEAAAPVLPDFPIESLEIFHREVWGFISQRLRSDYKLSEKGANEMAVWANQCLKQYVSPLLAEHHALACYMLCNVTSLAMVIAMRKPKEIVIHAEEAA